MEEMPMQTRLCQLIVLIVVFILLAAGSLAAEKPQPIANETLVPKRGTNSCLIDPRFRINLDGILGCVVDLTTALPAETANPKDPNVEPLVSFRRGDARVTKTATEEVLYHSLLSREQTTSVSFLEALTTSMGKKDQIEVTTTERPSVSIAYCDIDTRRIVETFKKLPAEKQAKLGVIIGLTPCVISTAIYTEKPTSVSGNYFGVKVGKSWLYKASEDRSDFYVIAVYAPISLLMSLADTKADPDSIDINMLLNEAPDDNQVKILQVPATANKYDPTPRELWQGDGGSDK